MNTSEKFSLPKGYQVKAPFVLGVDLDNTSGNYSQALAASAAEYFGVPVDSLPEPTDYSFVNSGWGFEDEAEFREVHGAAVDGGMFTHLEAFEGVSETLWALSDAGVSIHVITSRFVNKKKYSRVVIDTALWLDEENIPYRDISFVSDKTKVITDLLIDDSPSNIKVLRDLGRDVLVYDNAYNRGFDGPRAKNWNDVLRHVYEVETSREV